MRLEKWWIRLLLLGLFSLGYCCSLAIIPFLLTEKESISFENGLRYWRYEGNDVTFWEGVAYQAQDNNDAAIEVTWNQFPTVYCGFHHRGENSEVTIRLGDSEEEILVLEAKNSGSSIDAVRFTGRRAGDGNLVNMQGSPCVLLAPKPNIYVKQ